MGYLKLWLPVIIINLRGKCHRVTSVPRLNPSNIKLGLNINIMYSCIYDPNGYSFVLQVRVFQNNIYLL